MKTKIDKVKIIIEYNGMLISVIPKKIVPSVLKLIKRLIPKYFQQIGDRVEGVTIKIRRHGCKRK